ncbi:MAG: FAD-dependent oxidoreductase [Pirellulales bacterium]
MLSTGAAPNRPPFMEQAAANVFQLWTLDDMDATLAYIRAAEPKRAIVVGGGFVGLEVVEQLHRLGMQVTLVERNPQVLMPLDPELAKLVRLEMEQHGIEVRLGRSIAKLELSGTAANVAVLDDGSRLGCELVMVGAGVSPRIELAKASGLVIGPAGGVQVNEFMQTSDPNVYAVGDMTEVPHRLLGKTQRIPLAGPANRAGRIAGSHAASGNSSSFGPVLGTAVVRVFGLTAACTGLSEKACRAHGIEARTAVIQAPDHASYFPGAKEITLKLVYSPQTRKVLGAQGIGGAGVDKRIDVIATALHFGGSVDDLAQLDLAYAPPFGSAKDPVHMVAFTAQNDLDGEPSLKPTFDSLEGYQVVDVRNQAEIDKLPLAGAVHIPIDELAARIGELDPNKPTVVVCHSGKRAHVGACRLRTSGFKDVQNLSGGMSIRRLAD